jgi:signal transduction histidine kinase
MRNSLILKLMGAFLLLIFISTLVISVSTAVTTRHAFDQYSTTNRKAWSQRLAANLADFYATSNSWQGVDDILLSEFNNNARNPGYGIMMGKGRKDSMGMNNSLAMAGMMGDSSERLMLLDENGIILFDSMNELTGTPSSIEEINSGTQIMVNDKQVGTVLVTSDSPRAGTPAGEFLDSVNHSIVLSVLAGGIIAIILGAILFNQITSPLRKLKKAAVEVGNGNFKQRVSINSHDEFSDVGNSFNQMAESLENAEDSRQHYMADIAHELRTPLTAIQGTIEAMQDKILPLDEEQLGILHSQTTLLNRLINDLRILSMAETGHLKLDMTRVKPEEMIQQIVDSIKSLSNPKNIRLETDIEKNLPEWQLDKDRFAQILNNLLTNAIRYTPEGGLITISANFLNDRNQMEIRVTDSGIGISTEDLPKQNDRFYRADKSRARLSGGAGLGLAIVKRLVEAHGGQISVKSPVFYGDADYGYGTQFTISLSA